MRQLLREVEILGVHPVVPTEALLEEALEIQWSQDFARTTWLTLGMNCLGGTSLVRPRRTLIPCSALADTHIASDLRQF